MKGASMFWQIARRRSKHSSAEERAAEEGVEYALEVLSGSRVLVQDIVARKAGEAAREKIRGIDAVLPGTFRQVIGAVEKRVEETLLQKIQDIIADKEPENVAALRDVVTVGVTDIL